MIITFLLVYFGIGLITGLLDYLFLADQPNFPLYRKILTHLFIIALWPIYVIFLLILLLAQWFKYG